MLLLGHIAAIVVIGAVTVFAGDPLVRAIFHLTGGSEISDSHIEQAAQTLRAGRTIGWLERLATYACILANFSAGIAVIVAIKGLARYPDLKSADGTAERFIIGTLTSLLLAAAGAGLAQWITGLF